VNRTRAESFRSAIITGPLCGFVANRPHVWVRSPKFIPRSRMRLECRVQSESGTRLDQAGTLAAPPPTDPQALRNRVAVQDRFSLTSQSKRMVALTRDPSPFATAESRELSSNAQS
jgi:hypothetical protein